MYVYDNLKYIFFIHELSKNNENSSTYQIKKEHEVFRLVEIHREWHVSLGKENTCFKF